MNVVRFILVSRDTAGIPGLLSFLEIQESFFRFLDRHTSIQQTLHPVKSHTRILLAKQNSP